MKIARFLAEILCYLLIIFVSGELSLRSFLGSSDLDGNFSFGNYWLCPHHLPIQRAKETSRQWVRDKSSCDYDPALGWVPSPGKKGTLYVNNAGSIRVASEGDPIAFVPRPGVLRIAIFGDSFTYGYEVGFKDTWGAQLENILKEQGIDAQVLNFGVPGYGMDQAYLRWKKEGYRYAPEIVIFGLLGDDVSRNANLLPQIRDLPKWPPLFKPRFILENDRLKLVNSPTPDPQKVVGILEHYGSWELSRYEYWYDPGKYKDSIWLKSRFLSLGLSFLDRLKDKDPAARETLKLLGLKILGSFKADVESHGSRFYVLNLWDRGDLRSMLRGGHPDYVDFFKEAEKIRPMIDPGPKLLEQARRTSIGSLFGMSHYSAEANKIVAEVAADYIIKELQKLKGV